MIKKTSLYMGSMLYVFSCVIDSCALSPLVSGFGGMAIETTWQITLWQCEGCEAFPRTHHHTIVPTVFGDTALQ